MDMNIDWVRIWKTVVAYFKGTNPYSCGQTEKYENPQSREEVARPRFKPETFQIQDCYRYFRV
jgi:hypothetical protein